MICVHRGLYSCWLMYWLNKPSAIKRKHFWDAATKCYLPILFNIVLAHSSLFLHSNFNRLVKITRSLLSYKIGSNNLWRSQTENDLKFSCKTAKGTLWEDRRHVSGLRSPKNILTAFEHFYLFCIQKRIDSRPKQRCSSMLKIIKKEKTV